MESPAKPPRHISRSFRESRRLPLRTLEMTADPKDVEIGLSLKLAGMAAE